MKRISVLSISCLCASLPLVSPKVFLVCLVFLFTFLFAGEEFLKRKRSLAGILLNPKNGGRASK